MHRTKLLKLLKQYAPSADEYFAQASMIDFVEKYPECFERSCPIGHITASAWVVNKHNTHALLLYHTKLQRWLQPGGHCDGEIDVAAVALKEACEETGIADIKVIRSEIFDLDMHIIPTYKQEKAHIHFDVRFLLQIQQDVLPSGNHESEGFYWIAKESPQIPTQERSIIRMVEKWLVTF